MSDISELTLTVIKLGFLAVLWLFVLMAVSVMRSDLFGTRVSQRSMGAGRPVRQARPPKPPKQPKPHQHRQRKKGPGTLLITKGSLAGTSIRLSDAPVTVGRAHDMTIVVDDDYASGRHARLFLHDGAWYVEDLGSTNGTYLDRQKVTGAMPVPMGVPIRIGKTALELRK